MALKDPRAQLSVYNRQLMSTPISNLCRLTKRHQIKCLIDESGTPCRRCAKYRLQCVVNKNLQTIIDEKTQYIDAILKDLENTHILLRQLVQKLGLPDPKVLQTAALRKTLHSKPLRDADRGFENSNHHDDSGFSRDGSPEFSATEDPSLPHVPMQSLYALTKLKSLRSPGVLDQQHNQDTNDFTQRGATRRKTPIMTAAILTVAALHDSQSDHCRVSRDFLRAMCVASYWLSEISWRNSGHAILLASECDFTEAADGARLWFILRVCDQRLATLYGRPAIVHEDGSMQEIESFLKSPVSNHQDRRLLGQIALLDIFKSIRELSGSDTDKPIPRAYLHQLGYFNNQLDGWHRHWSTSVSEQYESIGAFPRKALHLHCQFAKLHLNSHVFRGLPTGQPIPHYFWDCATAAVVAGVVVGMPSYLHCMTAFAYTFLVKVVLKYGNYLIEPDYRFRAVPAGRWHLTKLMAPGLERMASMLDPARRPHLQSIGRGLNSSPMPDLSGLFNSAPQELGLVDPFARLQDEYQFDYTMNVGLPHWPWVTIFEYPPVYCSVCSASALSSSSRSRSICRRIRAMLL
ncbi:hypothetical protein BJY04DRAFT_208795 [Aspergillus karnatakaensis]|uniref:Zn(II)2Cys6 transcription factor domain-containing protein n=1 Tax=Aspergillus karnatakaensis TaxID=1810916 RepID=UPI003CCD0CF2